MGRERLCFRVEYGLWSSSGMEHGGQEGGEGTRVEVWSCGVLGSPRQEVWQGLGVEGSRHAESQDRNAGINATGARGGKDDWRTTFGHNSNDDFSSHNSYYKGHEGQLGSQDDFSH